MLIPIDNEQRIRAFVEGVGWSDKFMIEVDNPKNDFIIRAIIGGVEYCNFGYDKKEIEIHKFWLDDEAKPSINKLIDLITLIICEEYAIQPSDIMTKRRFERIRIPRQVLHYMLHTFVWPDISLADIGAMTGNFDHATVLHSRKVVDNTYIQDKVLGPKIIKIRNRIKLEISSERFRNEN